MNNISRKVMAGFAATTLAVGLVACSSDEVSDAANDAGAAASSVVNEATGGDESAAADASTDASMEQEAEDVVESTTNDPEAEDQGEMAAINTASGEVEVPAAFAPAIEEHVAKWGAVQDIKNEAAGSLAEFEDGNLLAFASETQTAVPLVGMIAETWQNEGGLDAEVGLPTAPEAVQGDGWVQQFLNGTISWMPNADGEFEATVEPTVQ